MPYNDMQRGLPLDTPKYDKRPGTGSHDVQDRYLNSGPSNVVPNPGYPFRKFAINSIWFQPYNVPSVISKVQIRASYGHGYRTAGFGTSTQKTVIIQNPVAPMAPTARGYESVEKAIRIGTFQAGMNAASLARRRRGQ